MSTYARFAERFFSNVSVRAGDEWMVNCPFHGGSDSLQFNVASGKFICFGCDRGGKITDLTDETLPERAPSSARLKAMIAGLRSEGLEPTGYPPEWNDRYTVLEHPYWDERGIKPEAVRAWGLGFDWDDNAATIPLWSSTGAYLHGVIKRSLDPDVFARYRYPKAFSRRSYLFGEHRLRFGATVFVTEGSLDAINLDEIGYTAVAVLGSSLSREQARLLTRWDPKEIILAFDNDKAGHEGAIKAYDMLSPLARRFFMWPRDIKDFGDLAVTERRELVNEYLSE